MRRSILPLLLVPAAAIAIAACGSSGGDSSAASTSGPVSVAKVDGSDVLTDRAGKTLYSTSAEQGGDIACVDACTTSWVPLDATAQDATTAAEQLHAKLATTMRPDGSRQLTLDGKPLYTFAAEAAGRLEGDGFTDDFQGEHFVWAAARTSGAAPPSGTSSTRGYGY